MEHFFCLVCFFWGFWILGALLNIPSYLLSFIFNPCFLFLVYELEFSCTHLLLCISVFIFSCADLITVFHSVSADRSSDFNPFYNATHSKDGLTFLLSLPIVSHHPFDICGVLMWHPQWQTSGRDWHVRGWIVPGCMSPKQVTMQWRKCCPLYLDFRKCWLVFYNRVCDVMQKNLSTRLGCVSIITFSIRSPLSCLWKVEPTEDLHCFLYSDCQSLTAICAVHSSLIFHAVIWAGN